MISQDKAPAEVAAEIQAEQKRELVHAIEFLMATPWGRRIASWVRDELGGLKRSSFNADSGGYSNASIKDGNAAAMHMALHEGRRAVAVDFHQMIEGVAPQAVAVMEQERAQQRARDLERIESAAKEQQPNG